MVETPTRNDGPRPTSVPRRRSYPRPFGRPFGLPFGHSRHKMTRAGLRNLARERSEALADLVMRREACRPPNDAVIEDHEYPHRRVTFHDLGTQKIYAAEHAAAVSDLRDQFARRGIRDRALDRYLLSPENSADIRTVSTALLEMAARLEK